MRYISLYKFVKAINNLVKEDKKITYYSLKKEKTGLSNNLILDCFKLTTALRFLSMRSYWRNEGRSSYDKIIVYKTTDTWENLQRFIFKEIAENNNTNKNENTENP